MLHFADAYNGRADARDFALALGTKDEQGTFWRGRVLALDIPRQSRAI
jgi:hypothetical protein